MEGKLETNATQNFGHKSGSSVMEKNAPKTSTNMLLTSEKLQCGPQQHFPEDVGLGHCHSRCSVLPGEPETGSSWGTKNRVLFWRANIRFKLAAAVFGESCDQRVCPPVRFNSNSMCQKNLKQLTMNGNSR